MPLYASQSQVKTNNAPQYCFQSEICDHEFEHFITEIERDPFEPEVVLITPIPYNICPDCKANGYDAGPGSANPPPKTALVIPRGFEGIIRKSTITMLPAASMRLGVSRVPSNMYNPGASRVPQPKVPTVKPEHRIRAPSASKAPMSSRAPSSTIAPSSSHYPAQSSVAPGTYKPTTTAYCPASQVPKVSTSKPMTAADYFERGAPKNAAASAFYNNPDGAEARVRIRSASVPPPPSHLNPHAPHPETQCTRRTTSRPPTCLE